MAPKPRGGASRRGNGKETKARRTRRPPPDPAPAAEGAPAPALPPDGLEAAAGGATELLRNFVINRRQRQRLDVDLVCGSITQVPADAYAVGIFRNVTPDGAAGAIDQELNGALGAMVARRMVSGEAGEITSFPTGRHRFNAGSVMLAGLGSIDSYDDARLEMVGENIMRTALLTRLDDFAIVPFGAASGTPAGVALEKLLRGFVRALGTVPDGRLRGVRICEVDPERFDQLQQAFYRLLRTNLFDEIEVTLNERRLPRPEIPRGAVPSPQPQAVYLLIREEVTESGTASVVASVLTAGGKAAIVQRSQRIDDKWIDQLAKDLKKLALSGNGVSSEYVRKVGTELAEMILPADIRDTLADETRADGSGCARPLVVVHDGPMSRVPWEMLHLRDTVPALSCGLTHRYNGPALSVAKWRDERRRGP